MTAGVRIESAVGGSRVVISACDLLAPFNDAGVLSPLDVHAAQAVGRLCGETDERALLAAALAVRGGRFGHVCIRLDQQRDIVTGEGQDQEAVEELPWPEPQEWGSAVARSVLVGDGSGDEPLVLVHDRLYLERYFRYEDLMVELIGARVSTATRPLHSVLRLALDRLLPPMEGGSGSPQHEAAFRALSGRLTVIAGGPGTGKTYVLGRMLAALAEHSSGEFPRVALCAPTGKAAARLGEEIMVSAAAAGSPEVRERLESLQTSTIHRLLGWTWGRGRFAHHARNRLPHDLVIVDEMSMVSLPLAAKLLSAVRDDAGVVLVGDPFQLESIEVGTVLADIVGPAVDMDEQAPAVRQAPMADRVVVLKKVHRFAERGPIAGFAEAVRRGDANRAVDRLRAGVEGLGWVPDPSSEEFDGLVESLVDWRSQLVQTALVPGNEEEALASLGGMAVLCANREGVGSVAEWQRQIERSLDERFPGLRYGGDWYPGRPVMITSNDYTLDLYNGDIGVTAQTGDGLRVVFERGGIRTFPPSYLGEHVTVHALTIHKSQGSQFDEVLVSLPPGASRLLTRELLYTAVTRASDAVTLIGPESVIRRAVERSVQRASGLRARLWR